MNCKKQAIEVKDSQSSLPYYRVENRKKITQGQSKSLIILSSSKNLLNKLRSDMTPIKGSRYVSQGLYRSLYNLNQSISRYHDRLESISKEITLPPLPTIVDIINYVETNRNTNSRNKVDITPCLRRKRSPKQNLVAKLSSSTNTKKTKNKITFPTKSKNK